MRPALIASSIVCLVSVGAFADVCPTDDWLREPMPVRDQFTLTSSLLAITPRTADVLQPGCSQVDVTIGAVNTFAKSQEISYALRHGASLAGTPLDRVRNAVPPPTEVFFSDGELHSLQLTYRRGVGAATDVEARLAVDHLSARSFCDSFIQHFHGAFGLGNDVRDLFPSNLQLTYIRTAKKELIYSDGSYLYSSLILSAAREIVRTEHQTLTARGLVKVPVTTSGFASRSPDEGLELMWQRRFRHGTFQGSAAAIHYGAASALGTASKTAMTWTAGWIQPLTRRMSLSAEIIESKSSLSTLRITELRRPSWQFNGGIRRQMTPRTQLMFGFIEHIAYFENCADFGLQLGFSWR